MHKKHEETISHIDFHTKMIVTCISLYWSSIILSKIENNVIKHSVVDFLLVSKIL